MKRIQTHIATYIALLTLTLTSCGNLTTEVEDKLNALKSKAESLDSLVNMEVDKVHALDSMLNTENQKLQKLDSIIQRKVSKVDSLTNF